ncbi:hypothetical protein GJ744_011753 [Endocarpon pusillum]|uniref:Uncharacterized protein n=1 Tax=Endocarpon pusillum TaxID=364733 RepID=A0A8H7AE47_9EURO|nr:hypothetical protein GJ744_011753 [Endocarpon pusillum]
MPTTKLASIRESLSKCQKIAIYHQATEDSERVTLYPAFPKELAIAYSGYIAKAFKAVPLSQTPLAEMKPKREAQVVIEGGNGECHGEVLEWILCCGKAGKTLPFRRLNSPAFHAYGLIYLSCAKLQVNVLQAQVQARMREIAAQQAVGAYKALWKMEEYREFKEGVDAVYDRHRKQWSKTPEGKAAHKETEQRQRKAQEQRDRAKQRRDANFQRAVARRHHVEPASVTPDGNDGSYTLSVEGRQVRKSQAGRPGFVQLDLATLGVSSRQFRAATDYPALTAKEDKNSSSPPTAEETSVTQSADAPRQVASEKEAILPGDKGTGTGKVDVAN